MCHVYVCVSVGFISKLKPKTAAFRKKHVHVKHSKTFFDGFLIYCDIYSDIKFYWCARLLPMKNDIQKRQFLCDIWPKNNITVQYMSKWHKWCLFCFLSCFCFFVCCNKLSSTRMSKEWKRINREKLIFLYSLHSTKTDAKLPVFHKMPLKTEASLVTGTHDSSKCVAGRRGLSLCQCGSCCMLYFINPHTGVREWEGRN